MKKPRKPKVPQDVVHIRLVNGDQLFGVLIGEVEGTRDFIIKEPMLLDDMVDIQSGKQMVTMTKYIWFDVGDIVTFQRSHVVTMVRSVDEISSYYQTTLDYYNRYATKNLMEEVKKTEKVLRDIASEKTKRAAGKAPEAVDGRFVVPGGSSVH
jgi:hypothetical protein